MIRLVNFIREMRMLGKNQMEMLEIEKPGDTDKDFFCLAYQ